jgi:hypothetical protein
MADLIMEKVFHMEVFTWGESDLEIPGHARATYISAMKAADEGNLDPLLKFAKS